MFLPRSVPTNVLVRDLKMSGALKLWLMDANGFPLGGSQLVVDTAYFGLPIDFRGVTPRRTSKERTYEGRVQVASCYKEVTSFTYAVRSHWGEAIGAPPGIHLNNSKQILNIK